MANPVFAELPTTIFEEMSALARTTGAINLGQGFPDDPGPSAVRRRAAEAVVDGDNQYPPMAGLPELRQAVARHYERTQDLTLDWASEVTVTSGATEALAATILGLVRPGDEVICFQPLYDSYAPMIRAAGGAPRFVSLKPPTWRFDRAMLEEAFSGAPRFVIFNNPMNPSGVVLEAEDVALLAEYCIRHDVIAICDEVWEQVVFSGARHRPLMGVAGMRERCVKIGSAGKMFGLTGWKVGFMCAAEPLTRVLARTHQFLTFTTPPNLQTAVAWGLDNSTAWFRDMPLALERSRDRLSEGLRREGFVTLPTQGTYFLNIDLAASGIDEPDRAFALRAAQAAGVCSIPVSALYQLDPVTTVLRLCFCKADAVLDEGVARLARARDLSRGRNASGAPRS